MKNPKVIIFDWDNTLGESRGAIVATLNETLSKYQKEDWETTKKKYRDPNKSLKENFVNFFGDKEKEAYSYYLEKYMDFKDLIRPVKNSHELLTRLAQENPEIKLIIISNKERSLLLMEIETLFSDVRFHKIMGNGDSEKNKPDASPVFEALRDLDIEINPENVWIVGDSKQDIDCAYNANCQPILLGKGNLAEEDYFNEKKRSNPQMKNIEDLMELLDLLH